MQFDQWSPLYFDFRCPVMCESIKSHCPTVPQPRPFLRWSRNHLFVFTRFLFIFARAGARIARIARIARASTHSKDRSPSISPLSNLASTRTCALLACKKLFPRLKRARASGCTRARPRACERVRGRACSTDRVPCFD